LRLRETNAIGRKKRDEENHFDRYLEAVKRPAFASALSAPRGMDVALQIAVLRQKAAFKKNG
jgi:hypothetical protein